MAKDRKKCLVTGAAGFIGSHLSEKLVEMGHTVIGLDSFEDFYSRERKERNLEKVRQSDRFEFREENVLDAPLGQIISDVDCVFHEAAQPGVRESWGSRFEIYVQNNILATQKMLEASVGSGIERFVYASSSSVYGDSENLPVKETTTLQPVSPYGVSKLAGERLCYLYWKNFDVPTVCLRYFTVYGPRQRPDMAFYKFITAVLDDEEVEIYGDGSQKRDYIYVEDVIRSTLRTTEQNVVGETFNIGSSSNVTINDVLNLLEEILGKKAKRVYAEEKKGDMHHTLADTSKAQKMLLCNSMVSLTEGLEQEVEGIMTYRRRSI